MEHPWIQQNSRLLSLWRFIRLAFFVARIPKFKKINELVIGQISKAKIHLERCREVAHFRPKV
jgi:hypothetical protein